MKQFLIYLLTVGLLVGEPQSSGFESGDVVGFWGDSITHAEYSEVNYTHVLYNYYVTHMPEEKIELRELGVGGAKLEHGLELYEKDPAAQGLTKVVLEYGINDLKKYLYEVDEYFEVSEDIRKENLQEYENNLYTFLKLLEEDDIENDEIIVATLPASCEIYAAKMQDEQNQSQYRLQEGFWKMSEISRNFALDNGMSLVEFQNPLTELVESLPGEAPKNAIMLEDLIHPNTTGQIYLAYVFLEQQGVLTDVSNVEIQKGEIYSEDAEVSNLHYKDGYLYYDYRADRLPMGVSDEYLEADECLNILDKMNREIIQVEGLKEDAVYDIYITGQKIGSFSGAEFQEGVNIANLQDNPSQKWANAIEQMNRGRRVSELTYRKVVQNMTDCGSGLTTEEELLEAYEKWSTEDEEYRQSMYELAQQRIQTTERVAIVQQGIENVPQAAFDIPGRYNKVMIMGMAAVAGGAFAGMVFVMYKRRKKKG